MKTNAQYLKTLTAAERAAIAEGAKRRTTALRSKLGAGKPIAGRNRAF